MLLLLAILVVVGCVDFFPNSVDRITRRFAEQKDFVSSIYDDDPCNLDSVCAIQTADRARRVAGGVVVLGRAADAVPRGCSLAIDAVLGG